ncbi:MarR family winged helix-turn-helix transcriptional regulator [Pseudoduganella sp. RAF53_2]|uniref:MarR family winged helix-turn-helix transcriptional regulator n=1 Tax=unclassified Pseudoduganella TaxID=2637179 RepID=UPI003F9DE964
MDKPSNSPWSDTPDISVRIVSAISRIGTVLRSGMWEFATTENLNPTQAEILQLLAARPEGVRLSWVARQLSISAASASDSVAALVSKGLVRKARAADDGRATSLLLTQSGIEVAQRIAGATGFADEAVAALPAATQQLLLSGLLQLIGQLQQSERFPELRACLTCKHFQPNRHQNPDAPHHCGLVGKPLPVKLLRLDCPEHEAADPAALQKNWQAFG